MREYYASSSIRVRWLGGRPNAVYITPSDALGLIVKSTSQEIEETRLSLTGGVAMLVAIGIGRFAYPPLISPLIHQHWFTPTQARAFAALNLAGYLIGSLMAPTLSRRASVPFLIRSSMLWTGFSFAAFVIPPGFLWGAAWRFSSGFTGALVMVYVPPLVLGQIRPHRRGWASGLIFTGVGAGIIVAGVFAPTLLKLGLPATWAFLGGVAFVLTATVWKTIAAASEAPTQPILDQGTLTGVDNRQLVLLAIAYGCYAAGFVPHSIFYVDYIARELQKGPTVASTYWIVFGAAALIGAPVGGLAARRWGFRRSLVLGYAVLGLGVGALLFSGGAWALCLSSLAVGISFPALTALTAGRITELVPPEGRKRMWSWYTMIFSSTYAVTGLVESGVLAQSGSYRTLFAWNTAVVMLGCLLASIAATRSVSRVALFQ